MKRHWNEQELAEHWTLTSNELQCIRNRTNRNRIGFAVTLKFFQMAGRFPNDARDIPGLVLEHIARQLDIDPGSISQYRFSGRSHERDRAQVRALAEFRPATRRDANRLAAWLEAEVLPTDHRHGHVQDAAIAWCRQNRIEPPAPTRLDRVIGSAMNTFQNKFFLDSFAEIPLPCRASIDKLLEASDDADSSAEIDRTPMAELRADPGRASLESVLKEIEKLNTIAEIGLPEQLFHTVPAQVLGKYRLRAATEPPRELRRHPDAIRFTLVAAFCYQRCQEIIDGLVDLLIQVVHRIGVRSERKVIRALLADLRKVHGKTTLLFKIAEVAVDNPDGVVKDVVYPVAGEQTLRDLVREHKSTGLAYQREVHTTMRASYSSHYRRMLPPLLDALDFRSNNVIHRPVINALEFLKAHRDDNRRHFALDEGVPVDGVVRNRHRDFVIEKDSNGTEQGNRINYEIAVLQALRERLRCKEIWVAGADRYRNPDDDLPSDFERNRKEYYAALNQPMEPEEFVDGLKKSMTEGLERFRPPRHIFEKCIANVFHE